MWIALVIAPGAEIAQTEDGRANLGMIQSSQDPIDITQVCLEEAP